MSASEQTLALLRSIDSSLKALVARSGGSASGGEVADDRDLDGKYGDPEVKFTPRDWTGDSFKGCNFSACPPELLDMLAETFDYFARKAEESGETTSAGKPVAPYKRKDAARARGWAKRIRSGWKAPAPAFEEPAADFAESEWPSAEPMTDADIPF